MSQAYKSKPGKHGTEIYFLDTDAFVINDTRTNGQLTKSQYAKNEFTSGP